jgi:adenylylsulfate kinase
MPVLVSRDPKGLYKRALSGELAQFTGVSDPYEVPAEADLHLHTDTETVDESLARTVAYLEQRSLIPRV